MDQDGVELSRAIRAVRDGLLAAQHEGEASALRFTVRDVTLDLAIEVRDATTTGGGVRAFVLSADAKGERSSARTSRLTVTLAVAGTGSGGDILIGDDLADADPPGADLPLA
ncbi:trypco2 family protein [Streptomyces sp. NPDC049040]|uniref:trypco2 family protein n=1 Tax=Streptomyces sp. NPDC049040 TaxID=3365593 RepID=UPI00371C7A81